MTAAARAAALAAIEERCPHCEAPRTAGQGACAECGLRLPPLTGAIPALRRGWVRRIGWYPGDWIWPAAVTLAVACAGAAVAVGLGGRSSGAAVTAAPAPAATTGAVARPARAPRPGRTPWPAGRSAWTIVLFSFPAGGGLAAPYAAAERAARAGLSGVGVLDSSRYSSLHPGYYVVFSGVYATAAEAETALRAAAAAVRTGAYTRYISR